MVTIENKLRAKQNGKKRNQNAYRFGNIFVYINLLTGDSLMKNILGVFVLACPETLLTTGLRLLLTK